MDSSNHQNPMDAATATFIAALAKNFETLAMAKQTRTSLAAHVAELDKWREQTGRLTDEARLQGFKRGFVVAAIPFAAIGACLAMLIRAALP